MGEHTPGPWRYREWGGLIVGGGTGSDEVLICTMATNTRHDEGRHNHALILAAPTMQARIAELEASNAALRGAIERAPHADFCLGSSFRMADGTRADLCNCWKAAALKEAP